MIHECDKGYEGQCCCNCSHQRHVVGHPDNNWFPSRSIMETVGYVCVIPDPDFYPDVIFFENKHGMCEYWEERDYSLYPARTIFDRLTTE